MYLLSVMQAYFKFSSPTLAYQIAKERVKSSIWPLAHGLTTKQNDEIKKFGLGCDLQRYYFAQLRFYPALCRFCAPHLQGFVDETRFVFVLCYECGIP